MGILYWWSGFVVCVVGLAFCLASAWKQRSVGLVLLATLFGEYVAGAIGQEIYAHTFVQQQVGPNTWTAPVVYVNVTAPLFYGVLLVASVLIARRLAKTPVASRA